MSSFTSKSAMGRFVLVSIGFLLCSRGATADETVQPIPALPPISIGVGLQASIYDCDQNCIYSHSTV